MMGTVLTKSNLTTAAIVAAAAILAGRFTTSKGKMINIAATVAAVAIALPFASKVG